MKNKAGVLIYNNTILVNGIYWTENSIIIFGGDNLRLVSNRKYGFEINKKYKCKRN